MKPHTMHLGLAVDEQLIKKLLWTWKEVLWKFVSRKSDLRPPSTSPGFWDGAGENLPFVPVKE